MLEVKNYSTTDIELDNVIIPYGHCKRFESIKDKSRMRGLMSSGKIAVVYVKTPKQVEDVKPVIKKDIVQTFGTNLQQESVSTESVTNTSTTKKKKSKDNDNNSEVENSKSTKGDMNNATD
jgi:hypothetical protein